MNVIELVTLKHPYTDHNTLSLCIAVTNGAKPRELFYIKDSQLMEFIACCLEMDPEKRYSAKQLLDHSFITTNEKHQLEFFHHNTEEEVNQLFKEYGTTKESWDTYRNNYLKLYGNTVHCKPHKANGASPSPEKKKKIYPS